MKPHQIISLMNFPDADNTLVLPDHDDHIHVGFRPQYGSNSKLSKQLNAVLKPSQWSRLIERLGKIDNPTVRVDPSSPRSRPRPRRHRRRTIRALPLRAVGVRGPARASARPLRRPPLRGRRRAQRSSSSPRPTPRAAAPRRAPRRGHGARDAGHRDRRGRRCDDGPPRLAARAAAPEPRSRLVASSRPPRRLRPTRSRRPDPARALVDPHRLRQRRAGRRGRVDRGARLPAPEPPRRGALQAPPAGAPRGAALRPRRRARVRGADPARPRRSRPRPPP